eukprot:1190194-Prorocentrum_minimum.AAC.2
MQISKKNKNKGSSSPASAWNKQRLVSGGVPKLGFMEELKREHAASGGPKDGTHARKNYIIPACRPYERLGAVGCPDGQLGFPGYPAAIMSFDSGGSAKLVLIRQWPYGQEAASRDQRRSESVARNFASRGVPIKVVGKLGE